MGQSYRQPPIPVSTPASYYQGLYGDSSTSSVGSVLPSAKSQAGAAQSLSLMEQLAEEAVQAGDPALFASMLTQALKDPSSGLRPDMPVRIPDDLDLRNAPVLEQLYLDGFINEKMGTLGDVAKGVDAGLQNSMGGAPAQEAAPTALAGQGTTAQPDAAGTTSPFNYVRPGRVGGGAGAGYRPVPVAVPGYYGAYNNPVPVTAGYQNPYGAAGGQTEAAADQAQTPDVPAGQNFAGQAGAAAGAQAGSVDKAGERDIALRRYENEAYASEAKLHADTKLMDIPEMGSSSGNSHAKLGTFLSTFNQQTIIDITNEYATLKGNVDNLKKAGVDKTEQGKKTIEKLEKSLESAAKRMEGFTKAVVNYVKEEMKNGDRLKSAEDKHNFWAKFGAVVATAALGFAFVAGGPLMAVGVAGITAAMAAPAIAGAVMSHPGQSASGIMQKIPTDKLKEYGLPDEMMKSLKELNAEIDRQNTLNKDDNPESGQYKGFSDEQNWSIAEAKGKSQTAARQADEAKAKAKDAKSNGEKEEQTLRDGGKNESADKRKVQYEQEVAAHNGEADRLQKESITLGQAADDLVKTTYADAKVKQDPFSGGFEKFKEDQNNEIKELNGKIKSSKGSDKKNLIAQRNDLVEKYAKANQVAVEPDQFKNAYETDLHNQRESSLEVPVDEGEYVSMGG